MMIKRMEIEFHHKMYVGGYENIESSIRLAADLDDSDDLEEARKTISKELQSLWAREMIEELRIVNKRRAGQEVKDDKLSVLMPAFKDMVKSA